MVDVKNVRFRYEIAYNFEWLKSTPTNSGDHLRQHFSHLAQTACVHG